MTTSNTGFACGLGDEQGYAYGREEGDEPAPPAPPKPPEFHRWAHQSVDGYSVCVRCGVRRYVRQSLGGRAGDSAVYLPADEPWTQYKGPGSAWTGKRPRCRAVSR